MKQYIWILILWSLGHMLVICCGVVGAVGGRCVWFEVVWSVVRQWSQWLFNSQAAVKLSNYLLIISEGILRQLFFLLQFKKQNFINDAWSFHHLQQRRHRTLVLPEHSGYIHTWCQCSNQKCHSSGIILSIISLLFKILHHNS